MTMRDAMESCFKGSAREPPLVLGLRVRAAEAGRERRAARWRRSTCPYSRDHQRRRGAAPEGHERADDEAVPGAQADGRWSIPRGQSTLHREARTPLILLLLGHRPRAAHRLREHRQPAAGAGRGPVGGDGRPAVDRREPLAGWSGSCSPRPACWRCVGGALGTPGRALDAGPDRVARCRPTLAQTMAFTIDGRVMLFAAGITVGTGLLFGLFPALHSTRPDLVTALKGQAGQPGGARAAARFRTTLVTAQIGLSMLLLVVRRPVRQEPVQRQPRGPRPQDRERRDLRRVAAAERLHRGAVARAVRAARGRTGRRCRA